MPSTFTKLSKIIRVSDCKQSFARRPGSAGSRLYVRDYFRAIEVRQIVGEKAKSISRSKSCQRVLVGFSLDCQPDSITYFSMPIDRLGNVLPGQFSTLWKVATQSYRVVVGRFHSRLRAALVTPFTLSEVDKYRDRRFASKGPRTKFFKFISSAPHWSEFSTSRAHPQIAVTCKICQKYVRRNRSASALAVRCDLAGSLLASLIRPRSFSTYVYVICICRPC